MRPEHAINKALGDLRASFFAIGTVTAISGATLTVTVRGGSLTMPKLASYTAAVNDTVQVALAPGRPFVLGKLG